MNKKTITMKTIFNFLLLLFILASCNETVSNKQGDETKKVYSKPSISENKLYDSYKPENLKLPNVLFVVIDAHADSKLAIKNFRWAAEQYGFHVIALNNVKNNDQKYEQHIQQGISQAKDDLQLDPKQIILAGFSGGARMALNYAFSKTIQGVIMMGAGPGQQSVSFPFPLVMITGTQDFNFIEQYYPITSPQVDNPNLIALHWQGKHEWPDSSTIKDAVSFILFTSSIIDEQDIKRIPQLEKVKQAQKENDLFLYFKGLELISKTSAGKMQEKTRESLVAIQQSTKAQQYFNRFNKSLTSEQKRNQIYMQDLDDKGLNWWKATISKLDNLIASGKGVEANSYARTRAYLGILLYSRTAAAVSGRGNAKLLPKYLEIYEYLEPKNPDLFFFKAVYAHALGNTDAAIMNLKKAIEYGFNDDEKLHQNFPQVIISAAQKP